MSGTADAVQRDALPPWVPEAARRYIRHTEQGCSIREVARAEGCHASTILRQIRRFEARRDDPLVDRALSRLGAWVAVDPGSSGDSDTETTAMTVTTPPERTFCDEETIAREARRVLRRLAEPGALLAVAPAMEKAAVLREGADGTPTRTAVVDKAVAEAFALKDWIACEKAGKLARYRITTAGRAALKRMLAEDAGVPEGMAEAAAPYGAQHRDWGTRDVAAADEKPRRMRYNMAESPVSALARRREKDGTPFLTPDLVAAAERLREDFELAQMGPSVTQNWERFLTAGVEGGARGGSDPLRGPEGARRRVSTALHDLGPGLGDTALRVCCYLEGLETTERRMGWSARSGKIVLRIALQRLARHYHETYGPGGGLIG